MKNLNLTTQHFPFYLIKQNPVLEICICQMCNMILFGTGSIVLFCGTYFKWIFLILTIYIFNLKVFHSLARKLLRFQSTE